MTGKCAERGLTRGTVGDCEREAQYAGLHIPSAVVCQRDLLKVQKKGQREQTGPGHPGILSFFKDGRMSEGLRVGKQRKEAQAPGENQPVNPLNNLGLGNGTDSRYKRNGLTADGVGPGGRRENWSSLGNRLCGVKKHPASTQRALQPPAHGKGKTSGGKNLEGGGFGILQP